MVLHITHHKPMFFYRHYIARTKVVHRRSHRDHGNQRGVIAAAARNNKNKSHVYVLRRNKQVHIVLASHHVSSVPMGVHVRDFCLM